MHTFQYTARDPLGNVHDGALEAVSKESAAQSLRRDGFQVMELAEGAGGVNVLPRRVSRKEIIYVTSQLGIMVETGITLSTALHGIAEQEENPSLRAVLLDLKSHVESGEDFSTALARHPRHFDKTFVSLIRASEHTGTMGGMLEEISNYLRKELETRSKVRSSLTYPGIMAVLAVSVTVFLLTFVLPKFEPLFNRKGVELPVATVVMMTASSALINYWAAWLIGAVLLLVGFLIFRITATGRRVIDWLKINTPLIGTMFRKVTISRGIRTLGTMVECGVPMLDAIRLTSEVSGNYYYTRSWMKVLDEVTNGNRIVDALHADRLFPPTLVQMIASGEETGRLDEVLKKVSVHYDQEVETSLKTVTSLIEPLMITVMGVVVGGIGLGLLLPIFQLSRGGM
ncbi:MAG: type II secretion system F family protein [Pirellulaceae bacterium]